MEAGCIAYTSEGNICGRPKSACLVATPTGAELRTWRCLGVNGFIELL